MIQVPDAEWQPTDKFVKFICSYSGCDGGNLKDSIWFCGIEYGGSTDLPQTFSEITEPGRIDDISDSKRNFFGSQYNRKVAKIYAAINGESIDNNRYKSFAIEKKLFSRESDAFKMNLYPLSFPTMDGEFWNKDHFEKTGVPTKSIYYAVCQQYRFPTMAHWVSQNNPRLIICTSLSLKLAFLMAFEGTGRVFDTGIWRDIEVLQRRIHWVAINQGQTILVVTPFLGGRYGLNSNELLAKCGAEIRSIPGLRI